MEQPAENKKSDQELLTSMRKQFLELNIPLDPSLDIGEGIRVDFCAGCRVLFPAASVTRKYILEIFDVENHLQLVKMEMASGDYYVYPRKFYIKYGIRITIPATGKVIKHVFDLKDRVCVVSFPFTALGDTIAWFTCLEAFQKKHECKMCVVMAPHLSAMFEKNYPDFEFIKPKEITSRQPYANYVMAIYPRDVEQMDAPVDYRQTSLHRYAAYRMGLSPEIVKDPPRVAIDENFTRPEEHYVCIGVHASALCKTWLNPGGWEKVVEFLKESGYKVYAIDRDECASYGIFYSHIPRNAEDWTGAHPISVRAAQISGADFFVGLGSGLSWLAWACKKPVVLVSGFSMPYSEFDTPYRVMNMNLCHGCYADPRYEMDLNNQYDWCPKHKGTARHYECMRGISAEMVIDAIKRIPEFQKHIENRKDK